MNVHLYNLFLKLFAHAADEKNQGAADIIEQELAPAEKNQY